MANYTGDYILYNADGSVFATNFTQIINKGSDNVNKIFVGLSEVDLTGYDIFAIFKLPNGTSQPVTGTSGSESIDNMGLWFGFTISIPQQVTAFAGLVKCTIYVEKISTQEILYTYPVTLTINDTSIAPEDLTFINLTQYKNMKEYIDEKIELTNDLLTETIEEKKGTKLYKHFITLDPYNGSGNGLVQDTTIVIISCDKSNSFEIDDGYRAVGYKGIVAMCGGQSSLPISAIITSAGYSVQLVDAIGGSYTYGEGTEVLEETVEELEDTTIIENI